MSLPFLYNSLRSHIDFDKLNLTESVNCSACPMAKKGIYKSELKCCTYYPFLPNYLVGGILEAGGEGARIILELLSQRAFVLPLGVLPPWDYKIRHKFKKGSDFGQRKDLLCPFFSQDKGDCSIWPFRNSACSTYFCTSDRGEEGKRFWAQTQETLFGFEMKLSQEYLLARGFLWNEVCEQLDFLEDPENGGVDKNRLSIKEHQYLWQHHAGAELDFFIDSYKWLLDGARL